MSILTATHRVPQFRCKPVTGGRTPIAFPYAAKLQGEWIDINHSFVEWSVGEVTALAKSGATA